MRHVGARPDLDAEVVGLDGERRLDVQLVVAVVDELEPLQQHAEHERGLLQGELAADAGPQPGAERLVGVRRHATRSAPAPKWSGSNSSASSPHTLVVAVQHRRQHRQRGALRDGVPAAEHGVLVRGAGEHRRGRPQPQRLVQDLPDVASAGAPARRSGAAVAAEHLVDLGPRPRRDSRVLQQVVDARRTAARWWSRGRRSRKVMHWAPMFSSGSCSPLCLSTPVSIRPSRSVLSAASPCAAALAR